MLKLIGLLIIFATCSFGGLYKSLKLKKRAEKLFLFAKALDDMAERIKAQAAEAAVLISACFKDEAVFINRGKISFNNNFLEKEDINLLNEFFDDFGARDKDGEYERTKFYAALLQKQYEFSDIKCNKLCRLYNSLGVLSGLFICIFLM